jgi:hypothetical protein
MEEELAFFIFGTVLSEGRGSTNSSPTSAPLPHIPWVER